LVSGSLPAPRQPRGDRKVPVRKIFKTLRGIEAANADLAVRILEAHIDIRIVVIDVVCPAA
jgi:hypothetical protein